ncbi:hypothetical protein BLL42_02290 [Pseudomonas frederiksbergensis]|uniref:Uncharacterized protein n=1 Tax=Pseudomonas frederiksbergensis TaxID=104087 RepID=A0A1J0EET3_9PSED|nr:hypothetical protein [Pseudomonas frederiksbergensis]APC14618.1 hypothetical protein BLL42_02290 [Pseudomonas frederiksbergensis]
MNPKDFVTGLKTTVVDDNISIYKDLFFNTPIENATNEYWKRALALFKSLHKEQQEVFLEVIRQTMVDTTSNILGVIDGVSTIDGANDEFSIAYGTNQQSLTGDLQSLFLADEEKSPKRE